MKIPAQWTFNDAVVAQSFDSHVREQLPWYELVSEAVFHIGGHYIPEGGLVYDIGCSTGNIGIGLADILRARSAKIVEIEKSREMGAVYRGAGAPVIADAASFDFEPYDFGVCFLVLMFMTVDARRDLLARMRSRLRGGGVIVVVDKCVSGGGHAGSVISKLPLAWKLRNGVPPEEVLKKELSLAGIQRPLCLHELGDCREFFRMGDFAGWILE